MNNTKNMIWISAIAAVVLLVAAPARAQEPVRVAENPLYRGAVSERTGGPTGISPVVPAVNANSFRFEVCYYYPDRDRDRFRNRDRYRYRSWDDRRDDRYLNRYDRYRYDYRYDSGRNWDRRYRSGWYSSYCFSPLPR